MLVRSFSPAAVVLIALVTLVAVLIPLLFVLRDFHCGGELYCSSRGLRSGFNCLIRHHVIARCHLVFDVIFSARNDLIALRRRHISRRAERNPPLAQGPL